MVKNIDVRHAVVEDQINIKATRATSLLMVQAFSSGIAFPFMLKRRRCQKKGNLNLQINKKANDSRISYTFKENIPVLYRC